MVTRGATFKFNLPVFWDDEYKSLTYSHEEFNDKESLRKWKKLGYSTKITGAMCDMSHPQTSWNDKFIKIFNELGWKDVGTSYYRMATGTVLPVHRDLYLKYISLFNLHDRPQSIRRAIVFLEDWKSGHYIELNGEPIVNWQAGQVIEWEYDTPHSAANLGLEDRYTLQITGHV